MKNGFGKLAVGLVIGVIFAAGSGTVRSNQTSSAPSDHIDPAIRGEERVKMLEIIARVPANRRKNVICLSRNDTVYVNRPSLRGLLKKLQRIVTYQYRAPNGETFRFLASDGDINVASIPYTCFDESRAAYRRVSSRDGYSYSIGAVYLRSRYDNPAISIAPTSSVYVMLGGRSSVNFEIDAGLIYSYTNDWWTNFIRRQGDVFCYNNACDPSGPINRTTQGRTRLSSGVTLRYP